GTRFKTSSHGGGTVGRQLLAHQSAALVPSARAKVKIRFVTCMMCLYHAVFRARETAADARGGVETLPESCCVCRTEQRRPGGPQRAFWRAPGAASGTAPENLSSAFFWFF